MLDSRCTAVVTAALVSALGGAGARPMSPLGITRAQAAALAKTPGELVNTTLALDRGHLVYGIESGQPMPARVLMWPSPSSHGAVVSEGP